MSDHDKAMAAKSDLIAAMREQHLVRTSSEPSAKEQRRIEEKARQIAERVEGNKQYRYQQQRRG